MGYRRSATVRIARTLSPPHEQGPGGWESPTEHPAVLIGVDQYCPTFPLPLSAGMDRTTRWHCGSTNFELRAAIRESPRPPRRPCRECSDARARPPPWGPSPPPVNVPAHTDARNDPVAGPACQELLRAAGLVWVITCLHWHRPGAVSQGRRQQSGRWFQ